MLTRKRPSSIPAKLTINGQGETVVFNVEYHNRTKDEFEAKLVEGVVPLVLFIVKSWESEYDLDTQGVTAAENERPGLLLGVIQGYHNARAVKLEKN